MFVDEGRPCPWGDDAGRMIATDGASMLISTPDAAPPHTGVSSRGGSCVLRFTPPDTEALVSKKATGDVPKWFYRVRGAGLERGCVLVRMTDGDLRFFSGAAPDGAPLVDLHYIARVIDACDVMETNVVAMSYSGEHDAVVMRAANGCRFLLMPVRL
jgi:hypothetical protein